MARHARPMSPHLQVYRPQITSVLSIFHRFTGVGLVVGALLLAYWLSSAAYGPEAFERTQAFMGSWFGQLLLFGWTGCLFYHLCNGIRHLAWDVGWGLEMPRLQATGLLMLATAVGLTVIVWIVAYATGGAS